MSHDRGDVVRIRVEVWNPDALAGVEALIAGLSWCTIEAVPGGRPPDVLLFELTGDTGASLQSARKLLDAGAASEVFLAARDPEAGLLLAVMRAGFREFFPLPLVGEDFLRALRSFRERNDHSAAPSPAPARRGKVISVFGGKGGIGVTTLAVNLALALRRAAGGSVLLLDMNHPFGEVALFFGLSPSRDWGEAARDLSRLDETLIGDLVARYSSGVHILPSPTHLDSSLSDVRAIAGRLFGLLPALYDWVVVDTGQSIDDISMTALENADTVILLTLLTFPCLARMKRLLDSFETLPSISEKIRLVVNRHAEGKDVPVSDAAESLGESPFWLIPNDYFATMNAINEGRPLAESSPRSPAARSIQGLADALAGNPGREAPRGAPGLIGRFLGMAPWRAGRHS